ncbi:hypothetical protein RFI_20976 [Reticulomyxa filosa]|uniref:FYVE-type domain-containing protein n=1 Tax=Reticulomyxa filosa TaxID=46433 RepID=X6MTG1_RETFI|nr:hypothetical protein RFI_20976 [Reticulomyxa filosa]|eukprot:ETO16375.1 hypothetical protein RFI_20976 [Reticulomyxa filosa]
MTTDALEPATKNSSLASSSLDSNSEVFWVPDKNCKECMECKKAFSFITRKHHCRNCGRVVCNECSQHSFALAENPSKAVRVCNKCFEELKQGGETNKAQTNNKKKKTNKCHKKKKRTMRQWLKSFEKYWLRNAWPEYYKEMEERLFQDLSAESKALLLEKRVLHAAGTTTITTTTTISPKATGSRGELETTTGATTATATAIATTTATANAATTTDINAAALKIPSNTKARASMSQLMMMDSRDKHGGVHSDDNPITIIDVGLLWVCLVQAHGLPDADLLTPPDGYCVFYVTTNDPIFKEVKFKTKTDMDTV